MPRRFGYIVVAVAVVLGVGALLMPVPEQVEVAPPETVPATKTPRPPTAPAVPSPRPSKKAGAPTPPAAAKAPTPPQAAPAPFPMQDTTKTRSMVQPQPSKPEE